MYPRDASAAVFQWSGDKPGPGVLVDAQQTGDDRSDSDTIISPGDEGIMYDKNEDVVSGGEDSLMFNN